MEKRVTSRLTPGELRRFGLTLGGAFAVLGGVLWWRGHETIGMAMWGTAIGLVLGGLVTPTWLAPLERAWMGLARVLSRITTPVFMGVVYFLVITPIGWVMRRLGRDPLAAPGGDTCWVPRSSTRSDMSRQF